ncbi:MAG: metallophosphoesterase [Bacteroides sp.]|nr:metallophosphoesterase [Bacteroides sp.]
MALSDFHFPFALPVSTFSQYVGTETLVLNGDILDCQSISSFPKLYRVPIMEEMIGVRNYLIDLITLIQPKEVHITVGNHEHRLGKYLATRMDTDVIELMPDTSLDYIVTDGFYHYDKRLGIKTWYEPITSVFKNTVIHFDGDWKCKVGKTIFCHPLTFSSSIMKTTEKAVNHFFRTESDFDAVVLGHTHKLGFYPQGNVALYEMGTCSDVSQLDYMNGKLTDPQQSGFLLLIQNEDGSINTNETKLIKL